MRNIDDINRAREERTKKLASDNEERMELYMKDKLKTRKLSIDDIPDSGKVRMFNGELIQTWTKIELAELVKVNPRTLYKWIHKGMFPGPVFAALSSRSGKEMYRHQTKVYIQGEVEIIHKLLLNFFNERSTITPNNSEIINSINEQILEFRSTYGE